MLNKPKRALSVLTYISFSLLGLLQTSKAKDVKRHNIVLFLIDDLGWRDIGCYGSKYYRTPNID